MQAMLTEGLGRVGAHIWTLSKNGTNRGWMRLTRRPRNCASPVTAPPLTARAPRCTPIRQTRIPRYGIPRPPLARAMSTRSKPLRAVAAASKEQGPSTLARHAETHPFSVSNVARRCYEQSASAQHARDLDEQPGRVGV